MAYYNLVIQTSTNEILYDHDGDELMRELNIVVDGLKYNETTLVKGEKTPVRKKVFDELVRIHGLFEQNKDIDSFEIYDSFQYSKDRKFSVEFLTDNRIRVLKSEEEENEL